MTGTAAQADSDRKLGPGRMVLVVGPSGAGKDTLLNALKERLADDPRFRFATRQITRPADGATETHIPISEADYDEALAAGRFALAWRAHGLGYILPAELDDVIKAGGTVVANGSRHALPDALGKYQNPLVLLITAPKAVLADRLAARGRESREEIERRLDRSQLDMQDIPNLARIENTGTVEEALEKILEKLT